MAKKPYFLHLNQLAQNPLLKVSKEKSKLEQNRKRRKIDRRKGIKMLSKSGLPIPAICVFLCLFDVKL